MLDFIKRICIALALALFIGMLFLGTNTTLAGEKVENKGKSQSFIWPTVGEISDTYGARGGKHYGIDVAAPKGTPVVSVASGVVRRSYFSDSYGQVVFITHDDGLETVYAHMHERFVGEGARVQKGEQIGTVGNTGRSYGNHLHFEVHKGSWNPSKSDSIDPMLVLSNDTSSEIAVVSHDDIDVEEKPEDEAIAVSSMDETDYEVDIDVDVTEQTDNKKYDYFVQAGDTLWHISEKFNVTVEQLKHWNNLQDDLIIAGSTFVLFPTDVDEVETYTITSGDTLYAIAQAHDMTVHELMAINDLHSDLIYPGEQLIVR